MTEREDDEDPGTISSVPVSGTLVNPEPHDGTVRFPSLGDASSQNPAMSDDADQGPGKKYGVSMILSPEFIATVEDKLEEKGWGQADLLRACPGLSKSSLSRMLTNKGTASSATVSTVARFFGIEDPSVQLHDPLIQRLVYAGVQLKEKRRTDFDEALAFLERQAAPIIKELENVLERKREIRSLKRKRQP